MIKYAATLLLITGCSSFPFFSEFKPDEISSFMKENPKADVVIFKNSIYPSYQEILDGDNKLWLFDTNLFYIIDSGKIIKTNGFSNDIEIINYINVPLEEIKTTDNIKSSALIRFSSPKTRFLEINYNYKFFNNEDGYSIEEYFDVDLIKWRGKNIYYFDMNMNLYKSIISLTPDQEKLIIYKKIAT